MNTVATPCMMAVPSMLTVAPNGTANDATSLFTPIRCSTVRNVTGNVAPLEEVLKATNIGSRILAKKVTGLMRPSNTSNAG